MASNGQHYHQFFSFFHPEWYETLDRYHPGDELIVRLYPLLPSSWSIHRSGSWFVVRSAESRWPQQGWKIHISATRQNCEEILQKVAPVCIETQTSFKFCLDRYVTSLSTSKLLSRGSSGKFITIYPENEHSFYHLLERLYEALQGFQGPYILSDKRYKDSSVLYYRYGGISGLSRLAPTGAREYILLSPDGEQVVDERTPYWNPPAWVQEPFEQEDETAEEDDDGSMFLKDGRYTIESVIRFSVAGGIYLASDSQTGNKVILKEARPWVGVDEHGNDAVKGLQKEYRLLQKLQETGITPQPVDLFWEWEHLFLAEEYISGPDLGIFTIASCPFAKIQPAEHEITAYAEKLHAIWRNLTRSLMTLHAMGIIHGDFTLKNVIVSDEDAGSVRIIDLESAWERGVDTPTNIFTPGFTHTYTEASQEADDIYGLGATMLASLFPINSFFDVEPGAMPFFVEKLSDVVGIAQPARELMKACMSQQASQRPCLTSVLETLVQVAPQQPVAPDAAPLPRQELLEIVRGVTSYIRASADLSRLDRLFPADPRVFSTNPLNISYGAGGIAWALARLEGTVPEKVRTWMLTCPITQELYPPGLYMGAAGVAWAFWESGLQDCAVRTLRSARNHPLLWEMADIFYGAAGYGQSCLKLYLETGDQEWLDQAVQIGDGLLHRKQEHSDRGYFWPDREGQTRNGYAQGASGIALYLLYLNQITGERRFLDAGRRALAFDLSYLFPMEGGYLSVRRGTTDDFEKVVTHYWLNGSAGVATTLLRYWQVTKDPEYLHIFELLIKDTFRQLTIFPGLFLGLSGLGNVLLDAYDFLGDESYLRQAYQAARGVLLYKIARPEGIAFPGEQLLRISTDFGTGSSGVALFLHRLAHADEHTGNFNFLLDQALRERAREDM